MVKKHKCIVEILEVCRRKFSHKVWRVRGSSGLLNSKKGDGFNEQFKGRFNDPVPVVLVLPNYNHKGIT